MFPTQEVNIKNLNTDTDKISLTGKSFLYDFSIGDFVIKDGKPVEISGFEALKIWISKVLKTPKDKYNAYSSLNSEYGVSNLKSIFFSELPYAVKKSEIERVITESLLQNSQIKSVSNFEFERKERNLSVTFNVYTIFGETESEVLI